jgi:hypothetical protein
MATDLGGLVVGVLATWRVTHLLQAEDGPGEVLVRLRRAVGNGLLGKLLDCFYCLSLWVAAPFAGILGATWPERGVLWLALSGGAILLERRKPVAPSATYFEDEEDEDVLLRRQTREEHDEGVAPARPAPSEHGAAPPAPAGDPDPPDDG